MYKLTAFNIKNRIELVEWEYLEVELKVSKDELMIRKQFICS